MKEIGTDQPKRWRCYNIWMPLSRPPHDVPLAMCDARSVAPRDLVLSRLEFKGFEGARGFAVELPRYKYNPNHRWAYFPDLRVGEVLFFLGIDPADRRLAPHSAFTDPACPPDTVPRNNSVEARALAVFD